MQKNGYISLVRSILDYGSIVWDTYLKQDSEKLERVQKEAARFITGGYRTREEGFVTGMLQSLELSSSENRRSSNRLIFKYKVVEGLVPAIPTLVNVKAPVVATTNWWWLISALVVA